MSEQTALHDYQHTSPRGNRHNQGERTLHERSRRLPLCLVSATRRPPLDGRGTAAQSRKKSTSSSVPCVSARHWMGEGQLLSQGRSRRLPRCLVPAPAIGWERDSCSAKEEVDVFIGALCQRPPLDGRGTDVQTRKKSTSSSVPCYSARHWMGEGQLLSQVRSRRLPRCLVPAPAIGWERDSCSAKEEVDVFLGALCQRPPLDGRGTAAQLRKKSTPFSVPCASARHWMGEGQLLSQGRSRRLPRCLVPAPAIGWERDSCSAKEEVDAFLGALCQRPPLDGRGTAAQPRKKSTSSSVPCASARHWMGEGQLLSKGRSRRLPRCLVPAPAIRWERDSCSAKEEVDVFLGALCQRPPLDGRGTAAQPRKKSTSSSVPCASARH